MDQKYTIGVDFGTLSARALVVRTGDGKEMADAVMDYPHGVIDTVLPETGEALPPDWALEDPHDFPLVLEYIIPEAFDPRVGKAVAAAVAEAARNSKVARI